MYIPENHTRFSGRNSILYAYLTRVMLLNDVIMVGQWMLNMAQPWMTIIAVISCGCSPEWCDVPHLPAAGKGQAHHLALSAPC